MNLKDKTDLTRWNRAGLSEFRYIDGNAITYLETLRQQLVEEFDLNGSPAWSELVSRIPEPPDETRRQTRKRLRDQYHDERRDYAWEILRAFARSAHVLGEYSNAYANEVYLPTAVEWDNIRRLVGMLGYRPAPPASAETHIALLFKEGESGEVEKGFAVKNKPKDGAATVIFETQEKLSGGSALNRLRLKDWERNCDFIVGDPGVLDFHMAGRGPATRFVPVRFPLTELPEHVSVGDVGVLATDAKAAPVKVSALGLDSGAGADADAPYLELQFLSSQVADRDFRYHNTRLYLQPGFMESPLAHGRNSARLMNVSTLSDNEIVFGKQGSHWWVARVEQNAFGHVGFSDPSLAPAGNAVIHRARVLRRQSQPKLAGGNPVYVLPSDFIDDGRPLVTESLTVIGTGITRKAIDGAGNIVDESTAGTVVDRIYYLTGNHGENIYFPAKEEEALIRQVGLSEIRFAGRSKDLESGSWGLVTRGRGSWAACRIDEIQQDEDWFEVGLVGASSTVSLLRGAFKLELRPRGHNVNNRPAWTENSNASVTVVVLDDPSAAGALKPGQKLICASDDYGVAVELKAIVSRGGSTRLHLAPPFHQDEQAAGLSRHACRLYANVARATHGETQPEKILGNGDATQTSQCFELPSDRVSWVADAGFSPGVRADLSLRVARRTWTQVENLAHSGPEEHHYQVKVGQDGVLSVRFGDGRHGRRLPTGVDNVRVRYRTGYGGDGNLAPHALEKIARPHRLVEGFLAPLAAFGGADKESAESMRESAPATVLALQRAVSLDDFTHLAAHHSMVWQARAFEKMPGRPARSLIEVVVVAAGGASFNPGSQTALLIRNHLQAHAAPDTPLSVISYAPVLLDLAVAVMVDEAAFDKKQVQQAVLEKLKHGLALQQRRLGQPLFRSEVIALIEAVEGVENGHCRILATPYAAMAAAQRPRLHKADDGGIRRVSVKPHQVLYLDAAVHEPDVSTRQYEV